MKVQKTYSLNFEVVKAFDEEVDDQTRSRLIEALMIEFLVKYSRKRNTSSSDRIEDSVSKENVILD
jgi:hypothetical protein